MKHIQGTFLTVVYRKIFPFLVIFALFAFMTCETEAGGNNINHSSDYTVTYNANGATGTAATPDAQTVSEGSIITLHGASGLTKTGFTFGGWNTLADGTGAIYSAGSSYTVTGNVTLYVYWLDNSWPLSTVTYNANGAGSGFPPAPQAAYTDTTITLPNQGSLEHGEKMFRGWNTMADGAGILYREGSSFRVSGDVALYAIWDALLVPGETLTAKLSWLKTNAESHKEYLIEVDATESIEYTDLSYDDRENITIILQGVGATRTIAPLFYGYSIFTVGEGVTLVLDNNITLQGQSGGSASLVFVRGGTLIMNEGSRIISGRGVDVELGIFIMNGGEITRSNDYGVCVYYDGVFIMNGGKVSGNTRGGVYVNGDGAFTMNGGEISGNTSSYTHYSSHSVYSAYSSASSGGGVYNGGTFTMNGGEISGNTSSVTAASYYNLYSVSSGGGVYNGGTFTMNGGKISGNVAAVTSYVSVSSGGGVYNSGIFTMNNGEISGNTSSATTTSSSSTSSGGGVYVDSSIFTKTGGIISGVVYAVSGDTVMSREDTVGQTVHLSFNGTVSPAVWSGDWYWTVAFDINSGTGTTPAAQRVELGRSITLPGSGFSRSGFSFYGWNTRADGTGDKYNAGDSYTVTGNITLYAQWIPSAIIISMNNGSMIDDKEEIA